MAQALFKSWFVDFDPVIDNALAAGNEIPDALQKRAAARAARREALRQQTNETTNKTTGATDAASSEQALPETGLSDQRLPSEIQQRFPDRFVLTDEMGWVPEGWEVKPIRDAAKTVKGKSYKSSELSESKTALVTLKSFNRGGGYRLDGLKEYTGSYKPEQEVNAGDLVIAYTDVTQAADVIGKPAMIISDSRYDHLVISLDVAVVRPKLNGMKFFLYGLAQTERFQSHTYAHSTGTTVLHLSKDAVPDFRFSDPGIPLIEKYAGIAQEIFQKIDNNVSEDILLTNLRDSLLPKLLSGQLTIPDAEQQLAEVL